MSVTPLISVLTPVLESAPRLWRALVSVEALGDLAEHIIIDGRAEEAVTGDGPPSASAIVVRAPARTEPAYINAGLARARGRYVVWLDPWAWFEPAGIEAMAARAAADDAANVVVGLAQYINDHGQVIFTPTPPDPLSAAELARVRSRWFKGRSVVRAAAFVRRDLVEVVGGYAQDNLFAADHALLLSLAVEGATFEVVPEVAAMIGPRPAHADLNREMVRGMVRVARRMLDTRPSGFGDQVPSVLAEIAAMERKLEAVDAMLARWRVDGSVKVDPGLVTQYREALARGPVVDRMRELGAPATSEALAASVHGLKWWKPARVLVMCAEGSDVVSRVIAAIGPLRAAITVLTLTQPGVREFQRSLGGWSLGKSLAVSTIDEASVEHARGPLDVVVTDNVLTRFESPMEALRPWIGRLRAGGRWAQLREPLRVDVMDAYITELSRRMIAQLSLDSDMILDGEADEDVEREAALERFAKELSPELPAGVLWAKDKPGRGGVDVAGVARAMGLTRVMSQRFGGLWHHPMTPWPMVEWGGRSEDAWMTSVWQVDGG